MTRKREVRSKEIIMGKLAFGTDLLQEITEVCKAKGIKLGRVEAIGAVQKACVGFYDQEKHEYLFRTIDKPLEILNLTGNISQKNSNTIVHAHVTLADQTGRAYGGHLAAGTVVFACEFVIEAFDGPVFDRGLDEATGLPLWNLQD